MNHGWTREREHRAIDLLGDVPDYSSWEEIETACRDELIRRGGGEYSERYYIDNPKVHIGCSVGDQAKNEWWRPTIAEAMLAALEDTQ